MIGQALAVTTIENIFSLVIITTEEMKKSRESDSLWNLQAYSKESVTWLVVFLSFLGYFNVKPDFKNSLLQS